MVIWPQNEFNRMNLVKLRPFSEPVKLYEDESAKKVMAILYHLNFINRQKSDQRFPQIEIKLRTLESIKRNFISLTLILEKD